MWNIFLKIFTAVHPPDVPDERLQQAWRQTVGWMITLLTAFSIFTALAMSLGVPGIIGQLVWAEDVKGRVEETTKPTVAQLQELSIKLNQVQAKVDETKEQVSQFLAQAKAAEIRAITLKRCTAATSGERDSYSREIDRLQFEYRLLVGERYDTPRCTQL